MSGGERKVGKRILEIWNFDHKCTWGPESEVIPIPRGGPLRANAWKLGLPTGQLPDSRLIPIFVFPLIKIYFLPILVDLVDDRNIERKKERRKKKKKNMYLYPDSCKHETRLPLYTDPVPREREYNRIFYQPLSPSKRRNIIVSSETSCFENYVISWTAWKKGGGKKKRKSKNISGKQKRVRAKTAVKNA